MRLSARAALTIVIADDKIEEPAEVEHGATQEARIGGDDGLAASREGTP